MERGFLSPEGSGTLPPLQNILGAEHAAGAASRAQLDECLSLLRGPGDERRCVVSVTILCKPCSSLRPRARLALTLTPSLSSAGLSAC